MSSQIISPTFPTLSCSEEETINTLFFESAHTTPSITVYRARFRKRENLWDQGDYRSAWKIALVVIARRLLLEEIMRTHMHAVLPPWVHTCMHLLHSVVVLPPFRFIVLNSKISPIKVDGEWWNTFCSFTKAPNYCSCYPQKIMFINGLTAMHACIKYIHWSIFS